MILSFTITGNVISQVRSQSASWMVSAFWQTMASCFDFMKSTNVIELLSALSIVTAVAQTNALQSKPGAPLAQGHAGFAATSGITLNLL